MSKLLWQRVATEMRAYAMSFPESHEDHPWGHSAFKVKKKVFTFLSLEPAHLGFSMKLPHSNATALDNPCAEPTRYGLGPSGWVTFTFREGDAVPVEQLKCWIEESYRAIAPKTLVARLDEYGGAAPALRASPSPLKVQRAAATGVVGKPGLKRSSAKKPGAGSRATSGLRAPSPKRSRRPVRPK